MAAASPAPSASPPPTPAPTVSPPPAAHPRLGELHDSGTVRKESVDADRWVATGLVKVTGDVHVGEGRFDGTISLGGQLSATAVRYRGTLDVGGALNASGSLVGAGSLRAGSTVHAASADLKGTARVTGALSVDRDLRVRGHLSAPSLTVGTLDLEGEARLEGDLVGLSVRAHLTDNSAFGTVRAKSVVLRGKVPNLVEKVLGRRVTVTVERVECDEAVFEGVDVDFVRAARITLGRYAHVTEYVGTIVERHPTSRVGFESKSPPPYGLRR